MDNREFSKRLETRTREYAMEIIRLSEQLPGTPEMNVIRHQFTKSGTSVGANYREANRSRSKADFANKIKICASEASETVYWLEIIENLKILNDDMVTKILREANELLALFTSITSKLKL